MASCRVKLLALAATVVCLVAGCSSSGAELASNKRLGVYLKVPTSWTEVPQVALAPLYTEGDEQPSPEGYTVLKQVLWERAWDSSRRPDPAHLRMGQANAPVARVGVRALTNDQRLAVSAEALSTLLRATYIQDLTTFNKALRDPGTTNLVSADFIPLRDEELQPEGFYGWRQLFDFRQENGDLYRAAFIVLMDNARTRLYTLTAHCNRTCFAANQTAIDKVLDSFTVRKP